MNTLIEDTKSTVDGGRWFRQCLASKLLSCVVNGMTTLCVQEMSEELNAPKFGAVDFSETYLEFKYHE
ncbi:hypothetical protein [Bartonella sp. A05]|uniref:hypothetical protein n=1 Tax=Bartonella sp. A05 TaxID=2967261 RepID=UPI002E762034|nr:hypothetical protein [Bartonella sp. A05]